MPSMPTTGVGSMSRPCALVVEADVAADDRDAEGAARLGHAVDGLGQLPHHLGVLGVAEVEAVDDGQRPGADAGQVEHRLGHDPAPCPARGSTAHQRWLPSVVSASARPVSTPVTGCLRRSTVASPPGPDHGVQEQLVVVLRATPTTCRPACASRSAPGVAAGAGRQRGRVRLAGCGRGRRAGPVVERGGVVQRRRRHVGEHLAVAAVEDAQPAACRSPCRRPWPAPPTARRWRAPRRGRRASTMASIRSWLSRVITSNGSMPGSRRGTAATSTSMPMPAAAGRLARGAREPGAAEVLDADDEAGVEQREARLDQPLLLERIADLHARALGLVGLAVAEAGRRRARSPRRCRRARCDEPSSTARLPSPRGLAEHEPVGGQHAEAQHVDERVAAVGLVEHDLAADGRARRRSCRSRRCRDTTPSAIQRLRASSSGPKRSGSISAMGRAPIVKMSRRMPPTPVAAPWYGSMADGWLWLSMRMAAAMPSPTSTTPAFSPGPDEHPRRLGRQARQVDAATTCTSSAPTTSRRTWPARGGSAARPRMRSMSTASSSVRPERAMDR